MKLSLFLVIAAVVLGAPVPNLAHAAPTASCGGYRLITSVSQGPGALALKTLAIQRARTLAKLESYGEVVTQCADLTGDHQPELIIQTYSGGAHCCFEIFVYQLHPTFLRVLRFKANNAGGFTVHRVSGRAVLELGDDAFAYYGDLCYACSPARLPLAACYESGRFLDCTRQFPQFAREYVGAYTKRLQEVVRLTDDSRPQLLRGQSLGLYASYALLNREREGLTAVNRIANDPALLRWLTAQRPAVQKWLSTRGTTLKH